MYYITAESVGRGHPDKMADLLADALLDDYLTKDHQARVALEVLIKDNLIVVAGEVHSRQAINIERRVRFWLRKSGYVHESFGSKHAVIINKVMTQSSELNHLLVDGDGVLVAGDQGFQVGFACDDTEYLMPAAIDCAHQLVHQTHQLPLDIIGCDVKAMVSVAYQSGCVSHIDSVILSAQHGSEVSINEVRALLKESVLPNALPQAWLTQDTQVYTNPGGTFIIGGPIADCGVTGRKLMVDSYGGAVFHGGGAYSGKDPSKMDRSGAYFARYIAKNIVAAGLARWVTVTLHYVIGSAQPMRIMITTGHQQVINKPLISMVHNVLSLKPDDILQRLELHQPIYSDSGYLGHFGRFAKDKPWEKLDMVEQMRDYMATV
ncbi:MAG: methionine adenosyltransferase [Candidatus Comchoanobacterales bacterium]